MNEPGRPAPILVVDGGTTNTRARLLDGGLVVATARRAVGVRDAVAATGRVALAEAVAGAVAEVWDAVGRPPGSVAVVGMLTSDVGLQPVPHVPAPAGTVELARGSAVVDRPDLAPVPILFIPGVRTPPAPGPDGWAEADVMRGEECETLGARVWLGLDGAASFVWPGSHTKLIATDESGRIVRSFTTLAGEFTATVSRHTLIAASLPTKLPDDPDPEACAAGMRLAGAHGLGRAAFLVRLAELTGSLGAEERASFWLGAVVGDDADRLAAHPILGGAAPIVIGGRRPLRALYARQLDARFPGRVRVLDDDAAESVSALGAREVLRARGEVRPG